MVKKNKNKANKGQQFLSPEDYLRQKARLLEIGKCYISEDFDLAGEGHVIVTRLHDGGKISVGIYMVDKFCLGVKDSFYRLRMEEDEFEDMLYAYENSLPLDEISYNEAHNRIYGAIAYAEEAGIGPDKSFALTQYLLEEDTEDIPLIEYEYGKDGKHYLVAHSNLEASKYLPLLKKNLGDDFSFTVVGADGCEDDAYDGSGYAGNANPVPMTEYTYKHPDYPAELELENQKVRDLIIRHRALADSEIDGLLALPHDSLRRDIENMLLYTIGRTCDCKDDDDSNDDDDCEVINLLVMLGEVGNEGSSLDVVLETLRQSEYFYEHYLGDFGMEVFVPTLYLVGRNRLDKLMDFMKEEGLYTFAKDNVLAALTLIVLRQPERRGEVVEWFREALRFAAEKLPERQFVDGTLAGFMAAYCSEIKASELLPEIKALYATGLVDKSVNGDYDEVEKEMHDAPYRLNENYDLDVHKRFANLRRFF